MIKNQANAASLAKVFLQWNDNPDLDDVSIPEDVDRVAEIYQLLILALLTKTPRLNARILEESVRLAFPKLSHTTGIQFIRSLVDVVKMARECAKHMTSGKRQCPAVRKIVQTIRKTSGHFKSPDDCVHIGKHKVAAKWAHSPNSKGTSSCSALSDRPSIASPLHSTPLSGASELQSSRSLNSIQFESQDVEESAPTGDASGSSSTCDRLLSLYGLQKECVTNKAIELSSQETVVSQPYDQFWDSHKLTMVRMYGNGSREEAAVSQGEDGFVVARFADGAGVKTECPNALLLLPIAMKRPSTKRKQTSRRSPSLSSATSTEKKHAAESPLLKPKKKAKSSSQPKPSEPRKRPAAMSTSTQSVEKPDNAAELRPYGCKRCRGRVGCTPSCWRKNTKPLTAWLAQVLWSLRKYHWFCVSWDMKVRLCESAQLSYKFSDKIFWSFICTWIYIHVFNFSSLCGGVNFV